MSSYNIFAAFYDALTENVDYEVRSDYISDFFMAKNLNNGTIVDLGCGTGSFAECFLQKGFNVIGVDCSQEMLTIAQHKLSSYGDKIMLINAKMQDFDACKSATGVICCLDSINHLECKEDVIKTFANVYNYLADDGIFVFDVNTVYKHLYVLADNTFVFDEDDFYLVWDNELLEDNQIRIILDFFIERNGLYERYTEEFCEKAYTVDDMITMLKSAGFENIKVYDELTLKLPKKDSERLYFVCEK